MQRVLEVYRLTVAHGGALPYRGGVLDQPARLIDALALLEGERPFLESLIRADAVRRSHNESGARRT